MTCPFPLPLSSPAALGLSTAPFAALDRLIRRHIAEGRYPGCQIAVARHGRLALSQTYGAARLEPVLVPADDDTLWPLLSSTKVPMIAVVWSLVEDGALSFADRVADHIPEFARHGKGEITLFQVATHQAGLPGAGESRDSWTDHARMRAEMCDWRLQWPPGSRMAYHDRSAHVVLAMVVEAVTGRDYREMFRERIVAPLGLADELFLGVPPAEQRRCADMVVPGDIDDDENAIDNSVERRAAGLPHGGGFATARAMAAFYQVMLAGGRLGDVRLFSPRMIAYATRDHTRERPDESMRMIAMHRGLGPHLRGDGERVRGLGALAAPATYGHGGFRSSCCWADPASGVSFAYVTNGLAATSDWHYRRLELVSNLVHAAID